MIWPELPYEAWKDTRDTLQLKLQVLGKVRLALTPLEPQWANVPLYVTARGLTTSPMDSAGTVFQADVDFIDHQVVIQTSGGDTRRLALGGGSVADFYAGFMSSLEALGIDVHIRAIPDEVSDPIPFAEDNVHAAYDPEWASRFFVVLSQVDIVTKTHRSRFKGRHTPVQFFWGTFDLAYARYSGRPADPPPGAGLIARRSADAEQICCGFWPGHAEFPEPAFYAYTYPQPEGIERTAGWSTDLGEFALLYADVRKDPSPTDKILEFFESTYAAGAKLRGWNEDLLA